MEGGGEGDADIGDDSEDAQSPTPGEEESPAPGGGETAVAEAPADGETITLTMPEMGESVTEGTVLEWHKQEGDAVEEGETVVEVSTDKVDAEVPAPASGTIAKILKQPDETVKVGEALAEISASGAAPAQPAAAPSGGRRGRRRRPRRRADGDGDGHRASPVARRVAAAEGVDLGKVTGSGPGGRITKADVLAANGGDGAGAAAPAAEEGEAKPLRGPAAMLAKAMNESRSIPTATSFRTLAVDTLDAKRKALNAVLKERGMKVSFTHLVAWAIVKAAEEWRVMGRSFSEEDGKPVAVEPAHINLGIAVDVERKGSRSLMVPCIKGAETLDFAGFHAYYEDLINKTRENQLTADDFKGTNITLTNPGGLGTVASVPRLMVGQGTIVATGSIAYPVEWQHAPGDKVKALGVSKVMTMTSTYDHRVIQGAESGSFLRRIDQLLAGEDDFYEGVAEALEISPSVVATAHPASASAPPLAAGGPGAPAAAPATGVEAKPDLELMQAVQAATSLLKAYRTHGHLAADLDPLGSRAEGRPGARAREPQPDAGADGPDPGLDPALRVARGDAARGAAAHARGLLRDDRATSSSISPRTSSACGCARWIETGWHRKPLSRPRRSALLSRLIEVFVFERFIQKSYLGQKMFSIEGLDAVVPMLDETATLARRSGAEEVVIGMAHRGRLSVLVHNLGRSVESIFAEFEGAKAFDAVRAITAAPHRGTGDVKYHHGAEGMFDDARRQAGEDAPLPEPEPSRVRRPGRRRGRPRGADRALRPAPAPQPQRRRADAPARRRRLPRPGRGRRDVQPARRSTATAPAGRSTSSPTTRWGSRPTRPRRRSTPYASDMAKGYNVPIIHVNADDVEACIAATRLAMAYREKFERDAVIDLIGYRRYGHNETDEAAYTQPKMAARIKEHPPVSADLLRAAHQGGRRQRRGRRARVERASRGALGAAARPARRRWRPASTRTRSRPGP